MSHQPAEYGEISMKEFLFDAFVSLLLAVAAGVAVVTGTAIYILF